ncbi:MAG: hypothetical protein ACLU8F_04080 [Clostridia bacterium]
MGAWGPKLFQDDIAEDVKDTYIDLLKQGEDNEEITKKLIEEYEEYDEDEISVFWFALASIQWDYGRLKEEVKEKALWYLKNGDDLKRWKEEATEKEYEKRKEVLKELEEKIKSPVPAEKKVRKYRNYICPWKIGDVYAYKIEENERYKGRYIVCIKVGEEDYYPHNICPLVYIYNRMFDKIPNIKELESIKYLPQSYKPETYNKKYENILYKCMIGIENYTKKKVQRFQYIGTINKYKIPENEVHHKIEMGNNILCSINRFEEKEIKNYEKWRGIEY